MSIRARGIGSKSPDSGLSLCATSVFSVTLWLMDSELQHTTETQRTQRLHREEHCDFSGKPFKGTKSFAMLSNHDSTPCNFRRPDTSAVRCRHRFFSEDSGIQT